MKVCLRPILFVIPALLLAACATPHGIAQSAPTPSAPAAAPAATPAATPVAAPAAAPATAPVTAPQPEPPTPFDLERPDIVAWIAAVSARHAIPADELRSLLAGGRRQPAILAAISRPAESVMTWWQYSERLVVEQRIAEGAEFWRTHRARLEAVSARTGVDAAYLVAIVGVESSYGRRAGTWRVLDALMTLGFDYPRRSTFFLSELEQFLLLVRDERLDPTAVLGSYAGAMGAPQFMPSSYRRLAVDGSGDGRRDLFRDWDDVFSSVANYFVASGWKRGAPVLTEATAPEAVFATLDRRNLDLKDTAASLRARGVRFDPTISDETPLILIPAEQRDGPGVRVGFANFRVITRYNRSILYAMAVHDLAEALRARVEAPAG
jgi:membrane-bound lytic murein transglycosylase B